MWVFGYGSLVSPESFARTVGRVIDDSGNRRKAELTGYGRRWNYGSPGELRSWSASDDATTSGVIIYLGLKESISDCCNGVVVRLSDFEIAAVDRRERDYARVDVSALMVVEGPSIENRVVTYVPRPSAIERYLHARSDGRAAVDRSYWDLVHGAFERLGQSELDRFTNSTPAPDVPIADVQPWKAHPAATGSE